MHTTCGTWVSKKSAEPISWHLRVSAWVCVLCLCCRCLCPHLWTCLCTCVCVFDSLCPCMYVSIYKLKLITRVFCWGTGRNRWKEWNETPSVPSHQISGDATPQYLPWCGGPGRGQTARPLCWSTAALRLPSWWPLWWCEFTYYLSCVLLVWLFVIYLIYLFLSSICLSVSLNRVDACLLKAGRDAQAQL